MAERENVMRVLDDSSTLSTTESFLTSTIEPITPPIVCTVSCFLIELNIVSRCFFCFRLPNNDTMTNTPTTRIRISMMSGLPAGGVFAAPPPAGLEPSAAVVSVVPLAPAGAASPGNVGAVPFCAIMKCIVSISNIECLVVEIQL